MEEELSRLCDQLAAMGCSREEIADAEVLRRSGRFGELARHLRKCRCGLMDRLHECARRVDRMDHLIRQAEHTAKEYE